VRGRAITATLVATLAVGLTAGCGGDSARDQGDKQLKAVAVPAGWREASRTFTDGGSHVPYDEWLVAYRAGGSALEALRAYDTSARAAGWQRDLDCGLELDISGRAGCWFRTGYRLRYDAQVDSPCTADCVSVTIRLVNE
jgi:hypothetical protein